MRDQMGNYIPNSQSYESEGVLKTGQLFFFNEDQHFLNITSNIALTGGLTLGTAYLNTGMAKSLISNYKKTPGWGWNNADRNRLLGYKKNFIQAKKGGGLATFILPDNLLNQNLNRQIFEDAGLFKQRSFLNPMKHYESMTASMSAGINALRHGKEFAYVEATDRALYSKLQSKAIKSGFAGAHAEARSAVKWGIAKGAGLSAINLASRALSFQEMLLPGQAANLFMGGDFGGIFQSIGHEAAQKQNSNRTLATMSYGFHDNSGAATMRQRSLNAIHNSQARLQQVFGQEAQIVHR